MTDLNKFPPPPPTQQPVNPYQAPTSSIQIAHHNDGELIDPQGLSVGAGWSWISDAWQLFKGNIGTWIITGIITLVISFVLSLIPIVQFFAGVLNVFFVAGVAYMAHKQVNDEPFSVGDLFIGFQKNTTQLILVFVFGVVAILGIIMVLGILAAIFGAGLSSLMDGNLSITFFLLIGLIGLALIIPISMAIWFAPILVILHNKQAIDAMKISFSACIRNILPFLWYGIVIFLLYILATIPLGLGWLVMLPLTMISAYTAYRQIMTRI